MSLRLIPPLLLLSALALGAFYAGAETATSGKLQPKDKPVEAKVVATHSSESDCSRCHTSHALGVSHSAVTCAECHIGENGLRDIQDACADCHKEAKDDAPKLSIFRGYHYRNEMRKPDEMLRPTCSSCHEDKFNKPISPLVHPVRSVGVHISCLLCHDIKKDKSRGIGASGWDYPSKLCGQCHEDVIRNFVLNEPHSLLKRSVRCRDCHRPHQRFQANLTVDNMALEGRNALLGYDPLSSNALCLRCHNYLMLTSPSSRFSYPGGFNLHSSHMDGQQASCVECHNAHSAQSRGMLRDTTLEGEPFFHFALQNGGSCTVTCHGHEHRSTQYLQ
jgi:predicted CXXCH cytochrome family protein